MKANSMQNLAIAYHRKNVYLLNFVFMSKNDAFNLIKNSNIIDKKGVLSSKNKTFFVCVQYKNEFTKDKIWRKRS